MEKFLALKVLEAILLSAHRKLNKITLEKFFSGINFKELLKLANERYKDFGFFIYDDGKNLELVTKPELRNYLVNFFGFEENYLTQEFLEVLAIVAYGGPIQIQDINKIRGKKSYYILKELLKEGYVKKENKFYRVSDKFLNFLGFKREKELPEYKKLRKEIRGV
jgi:segregation and condensation protein B